MGVNKFGGDWKDLNKSSVSSRARQERVQDKKQETRMKSEINTKNPFMKGMAKAGQKVKTPTTGPKPGVPQDQAKTKAPPKGSDAQKTHEQAQTKAEGNFQKARKAAGKLNKGVAQTLVREQPKPKGPDQGAKQPQVQSKPGSQTAQTKATPPADPKAAPQQAVAAKAKKAQQKAKPADKKAVKAKALPKDTLKAKKGEKAAKTDGKQVAQEPGSEGAKQTTAHAAVAGAAQESGKLEGKEKRAESKDKKIEAKKTKGKGEASRPAYTGSKDMEETTSGLASIVGGAGSEEEVPEEIAVASPPVEIAQEEVVEHDTGMETFTNIEAFKESEKIKDLAMKHNQQTIKPLADKFDYESIDLSKKSIRQKFYQETASVMGEGERLLEIYLSNAILPTSVTGRGSSC